MKNNNDNLNNTSIDLLDHIENNADSASVDTNQLLDMLEQEAKYSASSSSSSSNNYNIAANNSMNKYTPSTTTTAVFRDNQSSSTAAFISRNNFNHDISPSHSRRSSGDSSSFTSSFLGGLEKDKARLLESELMGNSSNNNNGNSSSCIGYINNNSKGQLNGSFTSEKESNTSDSNINSRMSPLIPISPIKGGSYSDSNTKSSIHRQPFDNPFRSQKQHGSFGNLNPFGGGGGLIDGVGSSPSKGKGGGTISGDSLSSRDR